MTQWYPPERVRVPERIAKALTSAGINVEVLTGIPHYPTGRVSEGYRAGSRTSETRAGVTVFRTPEYPSRSASGFQRLLNYGSWALSSALFGQHSLKYTDVSLVYSSPATAALPAMIGRFLYGTPYVLLIQDLWPDSLFATGYSPRSSHILRKALDAVFSTPYRFASHICVISPGMADVLTDRGVKHDDITLVYNWLDEDESTSLPPRTAPRPPTRLLYAGNHGPAQNLEPLIRAVMQLPEVELTMVGDGLEKQKLMHLAAGTTNVQFFDRLEPKSLARLRSEFHVEIASLSEDPLFRVTMPSKVQSIMASHLPILAIANGDVADLADVVEAGWSAEPGSVTSIRDSLMSIVASTDTELARRGRNGQLHYQQWMSEKRNLNALLTVLERTATQHRKRRA